MKSQYGKPRRRPARKVHSFDLPCENKRHFFTEKEAQDAADFRMLENMNIELLVYRCNVCNLWHLSSKKPEL